MYIITYKNRILNKPKKTTDVYYRSVADMENIKHCYMSPLFIKPEKKQQFAVQVCESKKSFAGNAEVQKITAGLQTIH